MGFEECQFWLSALGRRAASSLEVGWVRTGRTRLSLSVPRMQPGRASLNIGIVCDDVDKYRRPIMGWYEKVQDATVIDVERCRYLGGGLGLGVPVVSYAPRPMIMSVSLKSRETIVKGYEGLLEGRVSIYRPKGFAGRNASRTRVDSPVARAALGKQTAWV